MSRFNAFHPASAGLYFLSVLLITMFAASPLLTLPSLAGGIFFLLATGRTAHIAREFKLYAVVFLLVTITNPLFSHNGETPLFFLNGNPVTLEAILYGANMAITLIAVICWFKSFNLIMTEDKLLFLLGKFSPKIRLLLSSALRFIPLLKTQAQKIRQAQQTLGLFAGEAWTDRLKGSLQVCSALITWSLERAVDTGASMKARGYGTGNRSSYSLFRFRKSDAVLTAVTVILDIGIFSAMASGVSDFAFYPTISCASATVYSLVAAGAAALLSFLPLMIEVKEVLQWKYYRSRI